MAILFETILITSIYAGLVGLVLLLFKQLLKNKLSPKWHYLLWMILLVKLLVPNGPQSPFSLFNRIPAELPMLSHVSVVTPIPNTAVDTLMAEPITSKDNRNLGLPEAIPTKAARVDSQFNWLPLLWFSGSCALGAWFLGTALLLRLKLRKFNRTENPRLLVILQECSRKLQIKSDIPIIVQDVIPSPCLFGLIHPRILLPSHTVALSDKELAYVLMHELAHHKRLDLFTNQLLLLLQAIHWFNPVIWYCFHRIRADMEFAADQCVLTILEKPEHHEYGLALLHMLENYSSKQALPKLVCMVDDRRNTERRIRMIRMTSLLKGKRLVMMVTGLLCMLLLGGALLTSGTQAVGERPNDGSLSSLLKNKTAYVGNASKVAALLSNLEFSEGRGTIALQTKNKPYGIQVEYKLQSTASPNQLATSFRYNAAMLFALVDNVDYLKFHVISVGGKDATFSYQRSELQKSFVHDLRSYTKDLDTLQLLSSSIGFILNATPELYTPTMSSTPGIKISHGLTQESETRFTASKGTLLTWDTASGKITEFKNVVLQNSALPIYWSPLNANTAADGATIDIQVYSKGLLVVEKQLQIKNSKGMFYTPVKGTDVTTIRNPKSINSEVTSVDQAVSLAIKGRSTSYGQGEFPNEGHVILDKEEKNNTVKVYTVSSYCCYGFENGIFTIVSGSGAIPTVITFQKSITGGYYLKEYKEPLDGSYNISSIKEMFPKRLWSKVIGDTKYPQIWKQQEQYAVVYLKSIGRSTKVSTTYVEKVLPKINVDAQNKLFAELTKYDQELNSFPYWLGSKELLVDGKRYIYNTAQSKDPSGKDLITFRKTDAAGKTIKKSVYLIVGNEPKLIETEPKK